MKNLYFFAFIFIHTLVAAQQFNPTNGPTSGSAESKFVFAEEDLMFTGYDNHLLRSDDGGLNWYIVTANFPDEQIAPTSMIRKDDYLFLSSYSGDRCYRSINNGDTWETISNGLPTTFGYPASSPNRIEVSGNNLIMSSMNFTAISTDLGLSWQLIEDINETITNGVNQLESGLYISSQGSQISIPDHYIYKSLDNGLSWTQLASVPEIPSPGAALPQGTSAFAELNGYVYSSSTLNGYGLMRTNNNGETWENVGGDYLFNVGQCVRNYDGILYFTDYSGAYKSTDEGETWEEFLNADYDFPCEGAGYITRDNGKIWISTKKGPISYNEATGALSNPSIPNASLTNMKAGDGVILGLQNGKLYSSIDFGNSWENITSNVGDGNNILGLSMDENEWFVLAYQNGIITLFNSSNNGQTWAAINTVPAGGGGSAFFSFNPQFYAKGIGAEIVIYKSNDDGVTWNETSLTVLGDPLDANADVQGFEKHGDMLFADIKNGFAFSSDAGETWTARKLPADGKVVGWANNFIRLQPNGGTFQILHSSDNGESWELTTDGFPILAGVIQYAAGLGMVDGRVYVQNAIESGSLSSYPGYYYYLENSSTTWTVAQTLGQLPYTPISIEGTSENDLYVSTFNHGVWSNAFTTGLRSAESMKQFVSLYPNPVNDRLNIQCELSQGNLSIMDISGRVVFQIPFSNNKLELNTSDLKLGMYVISIQGGDKQFQAKFIKQ